ncbi:MAG TPA: ABC transporter ATP-binding protein [Candidatus Woesebacteria bacterium]|nr:ABC transporter ATP-binding protein [Candidatus Woesebacteria bacterium]HNS65593.1 ABC transporter ATP-binding protein [Candidatus Woesebacteria bacterium]
MPMPVIQIDKVTKSFEVGEQVIPVIKETSVEINQGEFFVLIGPSGSGKSTLLHIMLGLEPPTTGEVRLLGQSIYKEQSHDQRAEFRKNHIGMVYQQSNWIKALNVVENVAFPLTMLGLPKTEAIEQSLKLLDKVGLSTWAYHMPTELSGGQQQRVALARALANNPEILIADEPTGNLDYQSGQAVMELFKTMNIEEKKTIIMVTHDIDYLRYATVAVQLFDGAVANIARGKEIMALTKNIKVKKSGKHN